MVPEDLAPAAYRREIEQRIGFYRDIARAKEVQRRAARLMRQVQRARLCVGSPPCP